MFNLLRKEWIVTRWVHMLGAVLGLSLIPMGLLMAKSVPFVAVFSQLIYSHMLFSTNRQAANSRPDNVLLNSLPLTRRQIVDGKYLFVLLSAVLYATYLCLLMAVVGVASIMPLAPMWAMLSTLGMVYHLLLMPLSYINPRYGVLASSLIYLAILFVPQRFGKQINGEQILAFLKRVVDALGGWAVPVLLGAGLLVVGLASLTISRRVYARTEF